jgi:hypothetical protein
MASKKESMTSGSQHATGSFAQMVSKAQVEQLKPYVEQIADQKMAELANKIFSTVYQVVMQNQAQTQIRQLAFEKLLKEHTHWFKDEVLGLAVADVEDTAMGYESLSGPAQDGDKVRVEVLAVTEGATLEKILINSLGSKNQMDLVQTFNHLEAALVGMSVGESKDLDAVDDVPGLKVTVKRISRKKA